MQIHNLISSKLCKGITTLVSRFSEYPMDRKKAVYLISQLLALVSTGQYRNVSFLDLAKGYLKNKCGDMNFSDQTVRRSTFCSYLSFSTIPISVEMEDQDTDVTSKGYQRRDCYQMLMRRTLGKRTYMQFSRRINCTLSRKRAFQNK